MMAETIADQIKRSNEEIIEEGVKEIVEVIESGEEDYHKAKGYIVKRDGDRDLMFSGTILGNSNAKVGTGRKIDLTLYKTKGGKFVCQRIHVTSWEGEKDHYEAYVCDTEDEVCGFFEASDLAKELYKEAGVDFVEEVI